MTRRSVFETRVPTWWDRHEKFCDRHGLSGHAKDELFEIICDATMEEAAVNLGSNGGVKGGAERARRLTPEDRSEAARKAARARWDKK